MGMFVSRELSSGYPIEYIKTKVLMMLGYGIVDVSKISNMMMVIIESGISQRFNSKA